MLAFLVAGLVIVLGFLGEEFFKRTSIPDPLLLLLFGVLLGPVLNVFSHEQLISIMPYFAALALIVILFDGGLNMNIQNAIKNSPRALILAVAGFVLNVVVTALLCKYILGWRILNGLLLGSILGGGSSIIVIALARKLGVDKKTETVLSLESILTDVLCTIGAFVIIDVILSGEVSVQAALGSVALAFVVGIVVGSFSWDSMVERLGADKRKTKHIHADIWNFASNLRISKNSGGNRGSFSAFPWSNNWQCTSDSKIAEIQEFSFN